jgi:hypothetical protein
MVFKFSAYLKKMSVLLILFSAGNLYALDGFFGGLGLDLNANAREGVALGGGLSFGLDLNDIFSAGAKAVLSSDMDTVTTLETAAFFRYYFTRFLPLPVGSLFAQAETGASFFFENGEGYPAFYGGLTAGWRYNMLEKFYLEPSLRVGYPFIWGVGLSAGFRYDMRSGDAVQ